MIKNILVVLGILFFSGLQSQDIIFIENIDRCDVDFPLKSSTGSEVAIDGNYAVVGIPFGSANVDCFTGIAFVYKYDDATEEWSERKIAIDFKSILYFSRTGDFPILFFIKSAQNYLSTILKTKTRKFKITVNEVLTMLLPSCQSTVFVLLNLATNGLNSK